MPSLIEFVEQRQDQGLSLVLVSVGEDAHTVQRAVRQHGYDVPVLVDATEREGRTLLDALLACKTVR